MQLLTGGLISFPSFKKEDVAPYHTHLSTGLLECPHDMVTSSPKEKQGRRHSSFYALVLKV